MSAQAYSLIDEHDRASRTRARFVDDKTYTLAADHETLEAWLHADRTLCDYVAALEADRARLDWLEQNSATIGIFEFPYGDAWVWEVAATDDSNKACEPRGNGDTLREAIDSAMSSSPLAPTQEGA